MASLHSLLNTCARLTVLLLASVAFVAPCAAWGQGPPAQEPIVDDAVPDGNPPSHPAPQAYRGPTAVLHGVVKNVVTGNPLARVLVQAAGDPADAALTDGDGRFEIPGVPLGPVVVQLTKPGFEDLPAGVTSASALPVNIAGVTHDVFVVAEMQDVVFAMKPTNSIRGHIELSDGDPAEGINVLLLRRSVQDGRAAWRPAGNTRTNSDGGYRFGSLDDGMYTICTMPTLESDAVSNLVEAGHEGQADRSGNPGVFYPEARDIGGAGKIRLSGGEQAQANFSLPMEPFHAVRAEVQLAGSDPQSYSATVLDAAGHTLAYGALYDAATHSFTAMLPDGSYTLRVTGMQAPNRPVGPEGDPRRNMLQLTGQVDFIVAGRAIPKLRIALAPQHTSPLQVVAQYVSNRGSEIANSSTSVSGVFVSVSQADAGITDGMTGQLASGPVMGTLGTNAMAPGAYWVHTAIGAQNLCESSFTAGGVSLGHEPLVINPAGAAAPLTLTLRDDCASLKLSLPASLAFPAKGEDTAYTIYVVPDFDSTAMIPPAILRASSGGSFTLNNLSPGDYHVYTFPAPVELEYHNPEVLAALHGQSVTLAPDATASLVVEVAAQ